MRMLFVFYSFQCVIAQADENTSSLISSLFLTVQLLTVDEEVEFLCCIAC